MEPVVIILLLILLLGMVVIGQWIRERRKKNGQLALALDYERMVIKHKLEVSHVEVFDNRIIALDRKHKKLLFLHQAADIHLQCELVPLQEVNRLHLVEEREASKGFIKKVFLNLICIDTTYSLCFYDHSKDASIKLLPALRRARHWKQRADVNRNSGTVSLETEYVF